MRNSAVVLILFSSGLLAQTVRVPFLGCAAETAGEPLKAPKGSDKAVEINASATQKLAYYETVYGLGVLAPRGWHCFGRADSSGISVFVSPGSISPIWTGTAGPVVQVDHLSGGTFGRFEVAGVIARVFPDHKAFVQNVIELFDRPASDFTFRPYPDDKLITQTDRLVQFQTAPHSEGLGTMSRLKANDDPIDGVAMLEGKTPDLLMLRVRLPREQRDLTKAIIEDLVLRQRRDAR